MYIFCAWVQSGVCALAALLASAGFAQEAVEEAALLDAGDGACVRGLESCVDGRKVAFSAQRLTPPYIPARPCWPSRRDSERAAARPQARRTEPPYHTTVSTPSVQTNQCPNHSYPARTERTSEETRGGGGPKKRERERGVDAYALALALRPWGAVGSFPCSRRPETRRLLPRLDH